jgi:hypothetical protein
MLTKGEEYTDQGQAYYEERYRERLLRHLSQRASSACNSSPPRKPPETYFANQPLERCFLRGSTRCM